MPRQKYDEVGTYSQIQSQHHSLNMLTCYLSLLNRGDWEDYHSSFNPLIDTITANLVFFDLEITELVSCKIRMSNLTFYDLEMTGESKSNACDLTHVFCFLQLRRLHPERCHA